MKNFYILLILFSSIIHAQTTISINDVNFEQALIDLQLDDVLNGVVLEDSIINITNLNISNKNISSLEGISAFQSLDTLIVNNNQLSTLSITNNISLKYLDASFNTLNTIELNDDIEEIYLQNNFLEFMDLSGFQSLVAIRLENNLLKELNIANGNNNNFKKVPFSNSLISDFRNNPDLACVKVDNLDEMFRKLYPKINPDVTYLTDLDCPSYCSDSTPAPTVFLTGKYIIRDKFLPTIYLNGEIIDVDEQIIPTQIRELSIGNSPNERLIPTNIFPSLLSYHPTIPGDTISININCNRVDLHHSLPLVFSYPIDEDSSDQEFIYLVTPPNNRASNVSPQTSDDATVTYMISPVRLNPNIISDLGQFEMLKINDSYDINDTNFEQKLINLGYDDLLDGLIWAENIYDVTQLDLSQENIADLTGIEGFRILENLNISNNSISELDLSKNYSLKNLNAKHNQIGELDLSLHANLETLDVSHNNLTTLNINNGHNDNFQPNVNGDFNFDARNNSSLTCIEVSDENHMNNHFSNYIDIVTAFSEIECITLDADEFDQKFSIYPNPASTILNIESTQNLALNNIEIFNLKGQLVFQKKISDQLNKTTLELSSFQKGIYILKLSDVHGKTLTEKLIIQD